MPRPYPPRHDDQLPRKRRQRALPAGDRKKLPKDLTDAKRGVRLQKAMADAGVAARRDCEEIILQGRVKVNGEIVAAMPAWVDPANDRVEIDGQPMRRVKSLEVGHEKIYVLLNKPRRVITTTEDPDNRTTVSDMVQLPDNLRGRLFPVGRLDAESNGLILMTNDGELANRLTHPRYGVPKEYAVSIRGRLTVDDITTLKEGIHLAHLSHDADRAPTVKRAAMAQVELIGYGSDRNANERTRLRVTLREGQNREIRRMIARLGFKVRRLERIAIGPLTTRGLAVGQWRFLTPREVTQLQKLGQRVENQQNAGEDDATPPSQGWDQRPSRPNSKAAPQAGSVDERGVWRPLNAAGPARRKAPAKAPYNPVRAGMRPASGAGGNRPARPRARPAVQPRQEGSVDARGVWRPTNPAAEQTPRPTRSSRPADAAPPRSDKPRSDQPRTDKPRSDRSRKPAPPAEGKFNNHSDAPTNRKSRGGFGKKSGGKPGGKAGGKSGGGAKGKMTDKNKGKRRGKSSS